MRFIIPQNDIDESERLYKEHEQVKAERPKIEARIDKINIEYVAAAEELRLARMASLDPYLRTPSAYDRTDKAAKKFKETEEKRGRVREDWEDRMLQMENRIAELHIPYFKQAEKNLQTDLEAQLPAPFCTTLAEGRNPMNDEPQYKVKTNVYQLYRYKKTIRDYLWKINSCKTLGQLQTYMDQCDQDLSQNNLFSGQGEVLEVDQFQYKEIQNQCSSALSLPGRVGVWPTTPEEWKAWSDLKVDPSSKAQFIKDRFRVK